MDPADGKPYTCNEYRNEMILLTLHRRLSQDNLNAEEKADLLRQIREIELRMGMV